MDIAGGITNLLPGSLDKLRGPYTDKAAANAAIPNNIVGGKSFREGKFVEIGSEGSFVTHWWKGGYADVNLVEYVDLSDYTPKSDIINDLVTGGTDKPLSAEMGAQLADQAQKLEETLPQSLLLENDFEENTSGLTSFNSGVVSYDSENKRAVVTASSGSRGAFIGGDLIEGAKYRITVDLESGTTSARLYGNFTSLILSNPLPNGESTFEFIMPAPGAQGTKITLSAIAAGNFYVNSFRLDQINDDSLLPSRENVDSAISESLIDYTDDVLNPLLPEALISQNDFTENSEGVFAFASAPFIWDKENSRIVVTATGSAKGLYLAATDKRLVNGKRYRLTISIDKGTTTGLRIASRWQSLLASNAQVGTFIYEFVMDSGGNANDVGRPVVASNSGGEFYLLDFKIDEIQDTSLLSSRLSTQKAINASLLQYGIGGEVVYYNDFSQDATGVATFNGGSFVYDFENSRINVTAGASARGVYLGSNLEIGKEYVVAVNVGKGTVDPLNIGLPNGGSVLPMSEGVNIFQFTSGFANRIVLRSGSTGVFYCYDVTIIKLNPARLLTYFGDLKNRVDAVKSYIGLNAGGESSTGVSMGENARSDNNDGISMGKNAWTAKDNTYGAVAGNGQAISLGAYSKAWGWRCTTVGAYAHAGGQSSTALGAGAVALLSHSQALGRGAFIPDTIGGAEGGCTVLGSNSGFDVYCGNRWGHQFSMPISGIEVGGISNPHLVVIRWHGQDAFDERPNAWISGVTVSKVGLYYKFNDVRYKSLVNGITTDPSIADTTNWRSYGTYTWDVCSDFNKAGGDVSFAAGRGTGTGSGGRVLFETAPVSGTKGENEKNDLVIAGYFDSVVPIEDVEANEEEEIDEVIGINTRFVIIDIRTGAHKRVHIGAPDSGGTGKRMLTVAN